MENAEDLHYMRRAIELSKVNPLGPIGAVIVRDGVVLGEGYNRNAIDMDITAHGEMVAIRDGVRRGGFLEALQGATIYTSAQPCPMCYAACRWAGISRIVYALSCEDTYAVGRELGFVDVELWADVRGAVSSIPQSQLLQAEALPALEEWASTCSDFPVRSKENEWSMRCADRYI